MSLAQFDLIALITSVGYIGIFLTVFAESGLLIGVFLPGDSLLFTAGLLASQGIFSITWLLLGCFLAAVIGDNVGYSFGHKVGPKIFTREDSLFFRKSYVVRTQRFYERYGSKVLVLARFIPVVRSLAPILAGVGSMRYRVFFLYNVVGGLLWSVLVTLLGYYLGRWFPDVEKYLLLIVGSIVLISIIPPIIELMKSHREN